jgi:16S rRNA (uracil1498-N3)-methyltransferase
MTRRRWIADEFSSNRAVLLGAHATHLSRILRARIGQQFEVAYGDRVHLATVVSVANERVEFTLDEEVTANAIVPITLLLAVFKFDRMEWAIEKCTELNVTSIVPVIARRTEKHLALAADKRVERWRRIALEASEQSRRITPPEIGKPLRLKEALAFGTPIQGAPNAFGFDQGGEPSAGSEMRQSSTEPRGKDNEGAARIVLAETEHEADLAAILRSRSGVTSLSLAVGPEGGWAEDELHEFDSAQWIAASLGDTILRAETAAIASLVIARAEI